MESHIKASNVFEKNLEAYKKGFRLISNRGGSRSSKSYSIMQLMIMIAMTEEVSISVTSCAFPHLRRGALRDWRTIMEDLNAYDPNQHTKTEQVYHYGKKSYIEFFSVDNNLKVRGPGRDILFINEANLISFDTFTQLALRTRKHIFVDYNPSDEFHWLYSNVETRPDCYFIKSTYLDNPFLPYEQVKEIENLKNVDANFWRIYGEGERGHSEGVIYTHWSQTGSFPERGSSCYGLDFGYNNPTALVKVFERDTELYWKEEIYQSHLTNSDLIPLIKQIVKPGEPVYCDTAEPNRIEELKRAGIKALPANKDVKLGIDFVKSRKLYIHSGSANLLKEIKSYKYMDQGKRLGNEPEVPLKLNDHCFVGWTSVETSEGPKDLDQIQEFDLVHTSQGLKRVLKVWDNGTQLTKHYTLQFDTLFVYFRCTPDHLFWTTEGWKKISELKSGMTVSLINTSKDENTLYIQESDILETTNMQCTGMFGKTVTVRDQKGITSTIKMKTRGITDPETLNSRNQQHIYQNIAKPDIEITLNGPKTFIQKGLRRLRNGIKAMRGYFGTPNTENEPGSTENIKNIRVYNAGESLALDIQGFQSTATQTAKLKRIVEGHESYAKVYDLTVEDAHEYFANGVLVHNCMDAGRYASLHFKKAKSTGLTMSFHKTR